MASRMRSLAQLEEDASGTDLFYDDFDDLGKEGLDDLQKTPAKKPTAASCVFSPESFFAGSFPPAGNNGTVDGSEEGSGDEESGEEGEGSEEESGGVRFEMDEVSLASLASVTSLTKNEKYVDEGDADGELTDDEYDYEEGGRVGGG